MEDIKDKSMEVLRNELEQLKQLRAMESETYYANMKTIEDLEKEQKEHRNSIGSFDEQIRRISEFINNEHLSKIGEYFVSDSYREDTKLGTYKLGRLLGPHTSTALKYAGFVIKYYSPTKLSCISSISPKDFHINELSMVTENYTGWSNYISDYELSHEDFKILSETEYHRVMSDVNTLITMKAKDVLLTIEHFTGTNNDTQGV